MRRLGLRLELSVHTGNNEDPASGQPQQSSGDYDLDNLSVSWSVDPILVSVSVSGISAREVASDEAQSSRIQIRCHLEGSGPKATEPGRHSQSLGPGSLVCKFGPVFCAIFEQLRLFWRYDAACIMSSSRIQMRVLRLRLRLPLRFVLLALNCI